MSKVEVQRRLDYADDLLRNGKARAEVVADMTETFGISTRAADSYIARVRTNWVEESKAGREVEREAALARLDRLSGKAEQRGQFGAAVSAEKLRAQVTGILAPKVIDVAVPLTPLVATDDEMTEQQMMEELAACAAILTGSISRREIEPTPHLMEALRALVREFEQLDARTSD